MVHDSAQSSVRPSALASARPSARPSVRRRMLGALALAAASVVLLAGCSSDPLADQYREGSNKGYIAGDGTIAEFASADRGDPVEFTGVAADGSAIDSSNYLGEVLVVNFWYAACAPCRVEAPELAALSVEFDGKGAEFLGVNVRDQAETASSFENKFGIEYPSIIDIDNGSATLAFAGVVPPAAVPTTIVLDAKGRIAARILGLVESPSILRSIVNDVIAEGS